MNYRIGLSAAIPGGCARSPERRSRRAGRLAIKCAREVSLLRCSRPRRRVPHHLSSLLLSVEPTTSPRPRTKGHTLRTRCSLGSGRPTRHAEYTAARPLPYIRHPQGCPWPASRYPIHRRRRWLPCLFPQPLTRHPIPVPVCYRTLAAIRTRRRSRDIDRGSGGIAVVVVKFILGEHARHVCGLDQVDAPAGHIEVEVEGLPQELMLASLCCRCGRQLSRSSTCEGQGGNRYSRLRDIAERIICVV